MSRNTSNSSSKNSLPSVSSANANGPKAQQLKMSSSGGNNKAGGPMDPTQKKPSTPPAWSKGSTNPLTNRTAGPLVSNGITNNASRATNSAKGPPVPPKDTDISNKQAGNKMISLLANGTGLTATVTLKNGDRYSGIFSSALPESSPSTYTLKMVRKLSSHSKQANGVAVQEAGAGADRAMSFAVSDVLDLSLESVGFDKSKAQNGVSSSFRTDTDISGGRVVRERDLQKWDGASDPTGLDLSLDSSRIGDWDQFAVNKKITGMESTYDEHLYTTRIDKSAPDYHQKMADAERKAREIMNSSTSGNRHIAEERGISVPQDNGVDEETKYSGVQRDFQSLSSGQPNKYTPPARRPPTGLPTVPGAPVDPAIVSSSLAKPDASASTTVPSTQPKEAAPSSTKAAQPESKAAKETDFSIAAALKVANEKSTPSPLKQTQNSKEPYVNATENVEKDVVVAFRNFNATEKLKAQEHQRLVSRREKNVKLNDLKKFAENFKLNTEVPIDLVPILAKDVKKQQEIVDKAKKQAVNTPSKTTPPRPTASTTATPTEQKSAKPSTSRADAGPTSPLGPLERPNQPRSRPNPAFTQSVPRNQQIPPRQGPGNLGQRLTFTQQQHRQGASTMTLQPMPIHAQDPRDPRAPPTGPSSTSSGLQSPTNSTRWNAKANEFTPNPNVHAFVPTGPNPSTGSSPVKGDVSSRTPKPPKPGNFLEGRKKIVPASERPSISTAFNPVARMKREVEANKEEAKFAANGGIPNAYRTGPTWDTSEENRNKTTADMFQKPAASISSISPSHPNMMPQGVPYQNQLPYNPQQVMQMAHQTPQHTPRHLPVQPHHGPGTPHHYDDTRMQFSQSTSSVHPSPRAVPQYMAYGAQVQGPPAVNHFYQQGMPNFVQPGPQHMMNRQVSGGGPPFMPQQQMTGFVQPNGQIAIQPMIYGQPVPMQAYPQQGNPMQQPGPNGFPSPRPPAPMMAHSGSQQGHVYPQQPSVGPSGGMFLMAPPGPMTPMRQGVFAPNQQHQYAASPSFHHQQPYRGTPSGNYQQAMMAAGPPTMVPSGPPMAPEGSSNET